MSDAIESLYFGGKRLNLSESDESNDNSTSAEFERAVKFVHESEGFASADIASDEVLPLVKATYKELSEAVVDGITDSSVRYAVPDAMKYNLLKDTWMFSGMKTYHELKQCALLLLDGDGKLKSFSKFRNDIEQINSTYNVRYLEAERQYAVGAAMMAAKWHDFEADGDIYNLQYRTAGDDKVRADHAELNGITLPLNDKFWDNYLPPLDWGCRCTTVQVLADKYPVFDSKASIAKGNKATTRIGKNGENKLAIFRYNPGKRQIVFPPKHPYYAKNSSPNQVKEAQEVISGIEIPNVVKNKEQNFKKVKEFDNGGVYIEHNIIDKTAKDYNMVKHIGLEVAKTGKEVKATPKLHFKDPEYKKVYGSLIDTKYERKCPDLFIDGKFYEVESFAPPFSKDKLKRMFSNGVKQSDNLIINNTKGCSDRFIKKIIYDRIRLGQNIKQVWVYEKGKIRRVY